MKLGISGSRDIGDFDFREYFLLKNLNFRKFANTLGKESVTAIITGGARGIDTMAENAANMLQISTIVFHPVLTNSTANCVLPHFGHIMKTYSVIAMLCLPSGMAIKTPMEHSMP